MEPTFCGPFIIKMYVCFLSKKGVTENKMTQLLPIAALILRTEGKNGMKNRIHLRFLSQYLLNLHTKNL